VERRLQVESLFQEALERDPAERKDWLREACQGDSDLRREVASLLANRQAATDFKPRAAAVAQPIDGPAPLEAGQCLGPYRIECFLAAGGMGKVYRATDTRLHRQVAIKVPAARFSEHFKREARVIATLNHPNICQLHDVGPNYLVMELVEGPTLADRVRQGSLPVDEALAIARQITEALEAAHDRGKVHRDLKPANVKITPEGVVKVLDFGLAKAFGGDTRTSHGSSLPTRTMGSTGAGVILGTAAYMSPEQARGAAVDKRADIWAFGCVLYEMLSGRRAFQGETASDTLAAVLKEEPDWRRIPARMQPLVRRCLVKDPKHRLRDIGDAMLLIENLPDPGLARPLQPLLRVSVELSRGATLSRSRGGQVALSADGTRIAIVEQVAAGEFRLAARRLDESEFVPLPGTEGALMPFFSPDGQWIGFFANGKLKKIAVQGGAAITLCEAPYPMGASWGDDGNIIAVLNAGRSGLVRIPSAGGAPTAVTELNREKGEFGHIFPQVLPGSRAVLFGSGPEGPSGSIDVLSFPHSERKTLLHRVALGWYLSSGHLVYVQGNTLFAAPFDLHRLEITGVPQPVLHDVSVGPEGNRNVDFSQTGTVAYVSGKESPGKLGIFWLDSVGKVRPLHLAPGFYLSPRFSPDGRRLAFSIYISPVEGNVWVKDLERGTTSRLTSLPGHNTSPVWAPDGRSIVFGSLHGAAPGIYWIRSDGSGEPQRLTEGKTIQLPYSFSPDSKRLAFLQLNAGGHPEIWTAPIEVGRNRGAPVVRLGKAEPFLATPFSVGQPAFSSDGHWLAYSSNETGPTRCTSGPSRDRAASCRSP
jgi:serine/threonine-protein kinase